MSSQSMPDELLQTVGPVCRTLSLATLQSYMPPASHWKGLGFGENSEIPSNYVGIFIGMRDVGVFFIIFPKSPIFNPIRIILV